MWWPSRTTEDGRPRTEGLGLSVLCRLLSVVCLAALAAGCFQPLYGERTITGEPALRAAFRGIDVAQIDAPGGSALARIAVEVRNALLFDLTGGDSQTPPTHRLVIVLQTSTSSIIVDPTTARPEFEITALNANYRLIETRVIAPVLAAHIPLRQGIDAMASARAAALLDPEGEALARCLAELDQHKSLSIAAE